MTKKMKVEMDLSPEDMRRIEADPDLKAALEAFIKWASNLTQDQAESIDLATDEGEVEFEDKDLGDVTIRKLSPKEAKEMLRKRKAH